MWNVLNCCLFMILSPPPLLLGVWLCSLAGFRFAVLLPGKISGLYHTMRTLPQLLSVIWAMVILLWRNHHSTKKPLSVVCCVVLYQDHCGFPLLPVVCQVLPTLEDLKGVWREKRFTPPCCCLFLLVSPRKQLFMPTTAQISAPSSYPF